MTMCVLSLEKWVKIDLLHHFPAGQELLLRLSGLMVSSSYPRGLQGAEAGEMVDIHLYRSQVELEHTIFCVGSHDMTIDILAQLLSEHDRRLVSANVGSLGGLIALKRGEAHIAGSHLLDPETGDYNLKYIRQYLSEVPVNIYGFVGRKQGLMLKREIQKGFMDWKT